MYAQIEARRTWYAVEPISSGTKTELTFWSKNLDIFNGCSFKPRYSTAKMIFTDASDSGYGGFAVDKLGTHICTGKFTSEETHTSSTVRELLAVKFVLKSYGSLLESKTIQVNIDNQAATRILAFGSAKIHLQSIALDIFHYCIKHDIKLLPQWVPREHNKDADYFSRICDTDSWGIDLKSFEYIDSQFGPFQVDRFADDKNKKLLNFNSKYYCLGTSHVNSFTIDCTRKITGYAPLYTRFRLYGSYIATFVKRVLVLDPCY